MAGSHGVIKKDQLLELSKKISDLFNNLLPYAQFVKVVKGSSEYRADADVNKSTTEMEEVVDQYKISLEKLQNYLKGVVKDSSLDRGAIDLIEYLSGGTTTLSAEAKNFASSQGIVLQKNLSTGTVDVKIEESTLSSYKTTISGKTISVRGKLDKIEKLSKLKKDILTVDEELGDLNYDTEEKDTIAGTIKKYKAEWYKDKVSLKVMEDVFPEVKANINNLNNKINDFITNIDSTTDNDIKTLEKAVKFLGGGLFSTLDTASVSEIQRIVPNFTYSKDSEIKAIRRRRVTLTSEVNLKTLTERKLRLESYASSLDKTKGFINRHKKGVKNTLITLAVIGALAITGVLSYTIPKAVKGEEKPVAQSETVDAGKLDEANIASIISYQEGIKERIEQLQQKAKEQAWSLRLNGQDSLNRLNSYVDGTNTDLINLNSYDEEELNALSSEDLAKARSVAEAFASSIANDLDDIENSVGIMLTQDVSKDIFEHVTFTTLKTAAGNSIQSVSIDFVKDENGNYDSKMVVVVKSYDSLTKQEFYKYYEISTEDALSYLTDGEVLDAKAIQTIQDNGVITESGIDYIRVLRNDNIYIPEGVAHTYMSGVSDAIKKGKHQVFYKIVFEDGRFIQGWEEVENLKATNESSVVKSVYKSVYPLMEMYLEQQIENE